MQLFTHLWGHELPSMLLGSEWGKPKGKPTGGDTYLTRSSWYLSLSRRLGPRVPDSRPSTAGGADSSQTIGAGRRAGIGETKGGNECEGKDIQTSLDGAKGEGEVRTACWKGGKEASC